MQKIVVTYTEELMPLAIEMINHLVETFAQVHISEMRKLHLH